MRHCVLRRKRGEIFRMYRIGKYTLALGICTAVIAEPAIAHHSFAMFDQNKLSELKNVTVVQYTWGNPHVYIIIKSEDTAYTLECGSIANMSEMGWKFNTIKGGDKIDVVFYPLHNGKPGGALKAATLSNGKKLEA
ncbi:DUF6152 family protein [Azospirillum sp. B4]|uniref:DUF6152 family protein n=1 Tax=Azospirillum sp. B4 TaxID=95605 RepID=UPI0011DCA4F4|nr:DUF6152 family protein [Azospirillum sp. B4]